MKAGMTVFFQHPDFLVEQDEPIGIPDRQVYRHNLAMAEQAEAVGYDSVWSVEHHFTGYTMVPDVTQMLAYLAAKTSRIQIGSAAVILPWHNPVRAAESICMLDNLSDGRFVLGMGRGLGRVEFEGMNVPMGESRERFIEAAEMILAGLDRGYVEYEGKHYQQKKRWLRPAPTRPFRGRAYAAAVSPESQEIMARLKVGILISPQKPWETTVREYEGYRSLFQEINGEDAPRPIVTCQVFVDEDPVRAREEGVKHLGNYYRTAAKHYELNQKHLTEMKGYEYYGKMTAGIERYGDETLAARYADVQIYGTPQQCVERIAQIRDELGCDHFNAIFSYAGMAEAEAERNMRLWTDKVRPQLQAMPPLARRESRFEAA